jgi:hypothetical protein
LRDGCGFIDFAALHEDFGESDQVQRMVAREDDGMVERERSSSGVFGGGEVVEGQRDAMLVSGEESRPIEVQPDGVIVALDLNVPASTP